MLALPFEPLANGPARPLPVAVRLVADHLHRAAVVGHDDEAAVLVTATRSVVDAPPAAPDAALVLRDKRRSLFVLVGGPALRLARKSKSRTAGADRAPPDAGDRPALMLLLASGPATAAFDGGSEPARRRAVRPFGGRRGQSPPPASMFNIEYAGS